MKPYPFTSYRSFDVDRYLDEQLAAQAEAKRLDGLELVPAAPPLRFRPWAAKLNARIEAWMDRADWPRIDMALGTIGGFAITGVVVWFVWVLFDTLVRGRFHVGGN